MEANSLLATLNSRTQMHSASSRDSETLSGINSVRIGRLQNWNQQHSIVVDVHPRFNVSTQEAVHPSRNIVSGMDVSRTEFVEMSDFTRGKESGEH